MNNRLEVFKVEIFKVENTFLVFVLSTKLDRATHFEKQKKGK